MQGTSDGSWHERLQATRVRTLIVEVKRAQGLAKCSTSIDTSLSCGLAAGFFVVLSTGTSLL